MSSVFLPSFPDAPEFESLLSGASDVDLLAILSEVGGCNLEPIDRWVHTTSRVVRETGSVTDELETLSLATRLAGLQIDEMKGDGRISAVTQTGAGWTVPVAALEQRLLRDVGFDTVILAVLDEVFLRFECRTGPLFHPTGCYSAWVDASVVVGFLSEKLDCTPNDVESLVRDSRAGRSDHVSFVTRYLESVYDRDLLSPEASCVALRQLAALHPSDQARWLEVAKQELASGSPATAFEMSARLENAGFKPAALVRKEAEIAISRWN